MLSQRSGTYTFAGSRANQSQFAIDGNSMSDGVTDAPIGPLANYIESFKEVKLDLASNSAEFSSLGQVTIVSKSGTNRVSGALFDYYQSPNLRASDPFSGNRQAGVVHRRPARTSGTVLHQPVCCADRQISRELLARTEPLEWRLVVVRPHT